MSITSKLSKVSSLLFLTGFVFSKLQNFPIPFLSSITNAIALVFYMMGYAAWFISSHFYPNHTQKKDEWYGFAQFKEQYLYAATLGVIATALSLAALFLPILIIPAAWLFVASNLMWTSGEYHKFNNPPPYDKNYSHTYQEAYLSYAITMSSMTAIAAISTTLIILFPQITIPLYIITTILGVGLSILAAEIWLNCTFGDHKPTPVKSSHNQMNNELGPKTDHEEINSPAPHHGKDLFRSSIEMTAQPGPIVTQSSTQTCSMPQ